MVKKPFSIDIRRPLVLKANDLALLTEQDGDIAGDVVGFGLFYRDTCYLAQYRMRVAGVRPLLLGSSDELGVAGRIVLTNPRLEGQDGQEIAAHKLQIERALLMLDEGPTFADLIEFRAFCDDPVSLDLTLELRSEFKNVLAMRGPGGEIRGKLREPVWDGRRLTLNYAGADDVTRSLVVEFSPLPMLSFAGDSATATFRLDLRPREVIAVAAAIRVEEGPAQSPAAQARRPPDRAMVAAVEQASAGLLTGFATFHCSDSALNNVMRRSLADIALLGVRRAECAFTAAGLPWYLGLFGRDSLIPSLQVMAFNPDISARNVRALARLQGSAYDGRTDEQPGRILHELRVGELANLRAIPQTPAYSSVDSTPLFLVALARHVRWTGDSRIFQDLRSHVDQALAWIERREQASALGFVDYDGRTKDGGPRNEAWRDSGDGVLRADGGYPDPPLALVEVQGYAFMARREIAAVLRRLGEDDAADRLETQASALAERFDAAFWMEGEDCYSLAVERGGRQVGSVASNAAQVLWTGIARPDRARRIAKRMLRPDMFSGWGVRTLSADHPRYDPFAYQQGSVWPFDNALIVSGLRRYGVDQAAVSVFQAILAAALGFRDGRLPEFLAGTERRTGASPTRNPRADPLQAWSAGAVPFMVSELLGLEMDGFEDRLLVRRPVLPDGVCAARIDGLRLHDHLATVHFERRAQGPVEVWLESPNQGIALEVLE